MCFTVRKINIMLSLLLVVVCSWGQVTDAKNFTIIRAKRHYGRVTGKRQFGYRALDRL